MGELESCNTTPLYSTIGLVPVSFSRRPYAHYKDGRYMLFGLRLVKAHGLPAYGEYLFSVRFLHALQPTGTAYAVPPSWLISTAD